jgi:hypothetical protein
VEHREDHGEQSSHDGNNASGERPQWKAASAKMANPLAGLSPERLAAMGEEYCQRHGITAEEDVRAFRLGAMIAGDMNKFDTVNGLTEREMDVLQRETTHKWSNPSMLYWVIVSKFNECKL